VALLSMVIPSHIKVKMPFDFIPRGFYALCLTAARKSIKLNVFFEYGACENVFIISMNR
jgi:hypothetical protein